MEYGKNANFVRLTCLATALAVFGCGPCPVAEKSAPGPAATPASAPAAPPIRLQPAQGSGVLILEEESTGVRGPEEASDTEGLSERSAPPLPPGHQAFRDHHVILYVSDPAAGLEKALATAAAAGGQMIAYPISGFENLGPDERTLVFDARTYPAFLSQLQIQGDVVYTEIGSSDFVTVRLTVKREETAPQSGGDL